jgi:hypothetical protein
MIQQPCWRAYSSSMRRRARLITMPSGYWCDGVTSISFGGAGEIVGRRRDSFVVHRDRPGGQPHVQHAAHAPVARVLGPDRVAGSVSTRTARSDRLVDAGGNHDLLGRAAHRTRRAQIVGQRLAQQREPPPGA